MKIQAAVTSGPGKPFEIRAVELADPRPDEVLVRITGVGVCHTDIVFKEANMIAAPAVLGHEGSGIVERVVQAARPWHIRMRGKQSERAREGECGGAQLSHENVLKCFGHR
jgi:D-arabinose 1-dehydrogenase-like Zn-dependent alcohol dehydrogenase